MSKKLLQDTIENIELIKNMYENERLTYSEIGEKLDLSPDVIRRFMKRNGIQIRKHSETIKLKNGIEENIEEIIRLYLDKKLSTESIANIYNVDRNTISNYLYKYNINVSDVNKQRKTDLQNKHTNNIKKITLTDEELIRMYCEENLTATDIAKQFGATPRTVLIRLHELGAEVKQTKELLEDEEYKNQHIQRMKDAINENTHIKRAKTNIQRYGVDNPFKSEYFQNKAVESKYKYDTQLCSLQQVYIHNIVGGELNYPLGNFSLDIAFPNEMINIEYDGGGHDLSVTLNFTTREEFNKKESRRNYYLYRQGWKLVRIISKKDRLPNKEKIIEMINFAKEYLSSGRHYIIFDIDKGTVKTSQYEKEYDFGVTKIIRKVS